MQVMSLVTCPTLLDHPKVGELYPGDAIARAKQCLTYFNGGLGAYTDSRWACPSQSIRMMFRAGCCAV